jgi:hypothetical protein
MNIDQILNEAVDIQLHPNNFNGYADFILRQVWQPANNMLKQFRESFSENQRQAQQSLDCQAVRYVFTSSVVIDMYGALLQWMSG